MGTPSKYSEEQFLLVAKKHGYNAYQVAKALGIDHSGVNKRLTNLRAKGLVPPRSEAPKVNTEDANVIAELQSEVRSLKSQIAVGKSDKIDQEYVKRRITKLSDATLLAQPPKWLTPTKFSKSMPGVPTLFASDWHWAEVVDPTQINGVNEYNLVIAHKRARRLIEITIDLLNNHMVNPSYPGLVFALGGDMVSGDIHEELMASNEIEIMPTVLDLFGVLSWCIETLVEKFGRLFVPCVSGNHGRNTHKIRNKGRNHTSFDWLIYCFLAKRFENDKRITFFIPNGPDALYKVYNHRYLLTHGDAFRGGDGLIGALGPIVRGDHKKRGRQAQINDPYDTMLLGHFHQLIQLQRLIVNGSLKGYCEYAYSNNFGFEIPRQALWITHPTHGITFSMPVNVGDNPEGIKTDWVSWTVGGVR